MLQVETTVTFHKDEVHGREESRAHDKRKDRTADDPWYQKKGHEHIIQKFSKLNYEYDIDTKEVFNQFFTAQLGDWNSKQKKSRKVHGGKTLPAEVKKEDAKYWAMAWRLRLGELLAGGKYEKKDTKRDKVTELIALWVNARLTGDKSAETEAAEALSAYSKKDKKTALDWAKVMACYQETKKKHPRVKKSYIEDQIEIFENPITIGEGYYMDLQESGKYQPTYSFIVEVGSCKDQAYDNDNRNTDYWVTRKNILLKFIAEFREKNPNLIITKAYIHMDEDQKPAHLHLEVIPVSKSDTGKPVEVSLRGALRSQGYKGEDYDKSGKASKNSDREAFTKWCNDMRAVVGDCCKQYGLTPVKGKKGPGIARAEQYREYAKLQSDVEKVKQEIEELNQVKQEKDNLIADQDKTIEEKKSLIEEKDKAIEEKESLIVTLQKQTTEQRNLVTKLKADATGQTELLNGIKNKINGAFSAFDLKPDYSKDPLDNLAKFSESLDEVVTNVQDTVATAYQDKENDLLSREKNLNKSEKVFVQEKKNFDEKVEKAAKTKFIDKLKRVGLNFRYGYAESAYRAALKYATQYRAHTLYDKLTVWNDADTEGRGDRAFSLAFAKDDTNQGDVSHQLKENCYPWKNPFRTAFHKAKNWLSGAKMAFKTFETDPELTEVKNLFHVPGFESEEDFDKLEKTLDRGQRELFK